ncbi:MAG: CarD family transcriptional regulator [Lachnospiraceae bacterium]|nr:CarD family transcriptional regulator [Lachnospiraceae bacterium]
MFNVEDYVVCGNKGVCKVDHIGTLDMSGVDKDEEYYILKPVYSTGSTVYVPVETAEQSVRPVLSHKEADSLVDEIPSISRLEIRNEKELEQEYKVCIRSNDARELVKLLKTIYTRREARFAAGRKETALDAKYFRIAGDYLFGELAISLELPRAEVETYICDRGWDKA